MRKSIDQIRDKQQKLVKEHCLEREKLERRHEERALSDNRARQARFRKGLRGLFDRITGHHREIARQNEQEAYLAHLRGRQEKDDLIFR
jgi:hypothetical protein